MKINISGCKGKQIDKKESQMCHNYGWQHYNYKVTLFPNVMSRT
jgi:hypothetical protein